jgi:hypothetical protein
LFTLHYNDNYVMNALLQVLVWPLLPPSLSPPKPKAFAWTMKLRTHTHILTTGTGNSALSLVCIINNAHVNNEVKAKQQHNYMYVYVSSMVEGISEQNGSFGNFTNYTEVNNCSKKVVV